MDTKKKIGIKSQHPSLEFFIKYKTVIIPNNMYIIISINNVCKPSPTITNE